ncbi:hypothetical protein B484DRAFT_443621 [Ochromonadaceae sp. CCMP2298]|nr:hypothetical protein B484DRAFT_443621 [Ochromonadaceae sp. CCMP2298]|mmetsp:Transcript_1950/g.4541  ORF Transcript_1950/g.4541 Transcript_1950/m.4541 type:complete len:87 (-) Transcript_1950:34-294(-)|eukprot:CAMPEP_0173286580 /NCGR_PEP_ID=MMETSP1143-20121109/9271_1 /TAXON_ID=483371 /ORGANISM="non described non described, Strain CCMP2298" /LENGTH=86 /DNA_ID=CAMNT_0014224911 /DNA_START=161 /DNA_END=418 /DNA_ORIENTATION=+
MNAAVDDYLSSRPEISGFLSVDHSGLVIASRGDIDPATAGRYTAMVREAGRMHPSIHPPKIVIETATAHVLVKSYDAGTVVVRSKA